MENEEILDQRLIKKITHELEGESLLDCMVAVLFLVEHLANQICEDDNLPEETKKFFEDLSVTADFHRGSILQSLAQGTLNESGTIQ